MPHLFPATLRLLLRGVCALAWLAWLLAPPHAAAVQFSGASDLETGIGFTTVLDLGPEDPDPGSRADGCLYAVHGSDGAVHRVCFDAAKQVTSHTTVVDINGGGSVNNVLGITFEPGSDPAGEIRMYLGYADTNTAPFNGKIARAVSTDGGVSYAVDEDFITGLARSAFDHQTNGLDFGPDGCLYISQGNNSNAGYDTDFAESRLSSGILRACFLSGGGVDPGFDRNCGGGNTQEACDVEVYASGLRNPYDIVWHSNGRLYNADNDSNPGFRDACGSQANDFGCPCQEPQVTPIGDEINLIEPGMYYGSPNPYRANPSGMQCNGGTNGGDACSNSGQCGGGSCVDLSALCTDSVCGDVAQCYYFGYGESPQAGEDPNGIYRQPIAQVGALLDGLTEYRSRFESRFGPPFCSDWSGDLLATGGPGALRRFSLSPDGTAATDQGGSGLGGLSGLDVVVGPDGSIYVADLNGGKITYKAPVSQPDPQQPDYFGVCPAGEVCSDGACIAECQSDPECDDGNPCTDDVCAAGSCEYTDNTDPCDDGASCTTSDTCQGGLCTGNDVCPGGEVCNVPADMCELATATVRINVNGPQVSGIDHPGTWAADPGVGGVCGSGAYTNSAAIQGTADDALFQGEVYGNPVSCQVDDGGSPLPAGDYQVTLHFAEIYFGPGCPGGGSGTGSRVFDIALEGTTVETGVDLFAEAGCAASTSDPGAPVAKSYPVTITDGTLDISLPASADNGKISAIEIVPAGPAAECSTDPECDDLDPCTTDVCNAGSCENTFDPGQCLDQYPSGEDFEAAPLWSNAGGDDFDWTVRSGPTPSNGTGPDGDHTTGAGFYSYTEATGQQTGDVALLEGPCLELAGMAQAHFDFWYHMLGSAMGTLEVEAAPDCGTSWSSVFTRSGDQGSEWQLGSVDLAGYLGQRVRLRFRGVRGSGFQSDIAVDDILVRASSAPPTAVPSDVQMPGTQPHEVNDLDAATDCSLCHQGYNVASPLDEPSHGWGGSMMAHASRDPVFWAALAVAEQGFAGSGDLCLRCHVPKGWLAGRSEPTDGSALLDSDADGVGCDLCHRLTDPDGSGQVGVQNPPFLAHDGGAPPTAFRGAGQYVVWNQPSKLGPYDDASAPHSFEQSGFVRSADLCGTCHDVSNPLTGDLAPNNGAQVPLAPGTFSGVPGSPVQLKAAFNNLPHQYGAIERTTSEHAAGLLSQLPISNYASLPAELQAGAIAAARNAALLAGNGGDYDDGTPRTFSCQSCHMRARSGEGCSLSPGVRDDLPAHDLTGGNYWAPDAIQYLDGLSQLRLGGGLNAVQVQQLDAGRDRAGQNLEEAASLSLAGNVLRVVNLTGHKLITGYPEGRRMWLNVQWFAADETLLAEEGAYGALDVSIDGQPSQVETLLDPANTLTYDVHNAITQEWAAQLITLGVAPSLPLRYDRVTGAVTDTLGDLAAQAPGTWLETFHFALNNYTAHDSRIPPYGMSYDEALARNALPVPEDQYGDPGPGGSYDYFDEVQLAPPPGAHHAQITLYYQPTSWEYVQFLYLANDGSNAFLAEEGARLLDAWLQTGMAEPYPMADINWEAPAVCGNGSLEPGESCDDGNLDPGDCCSPTCTFESAATECRAAADVCDVAELCPGDSGTCPPDSFAPATQVCRMGGGGGCDAWELCTGTGPACPPDHFQPSTTVCRELAGPCDVEELCPGDTRFCPPDSFLPDTTECRPAAGVCDIAEFCSGSAAQCPANAHEPDTLVCRPAAGPCDIEETCTGTTSHCPTNLLEPDTTVCRATTGACDPEELCTGASVACPADDFEPDGTPCGDANVCNGDELCASGVCAAGAPLNCFDGDQCTVDVCDAALGCSNPPLPDCEAEPIPALPGGTLPILGLLLALASRGAARRWRRASSRSPGPPRCS